MPVPPLSRPRASRSALAAFLFFALLPVEAMAGRSPTPRPSEPVTPGTTWTSGEAESPACQRSRRKLWQAGEGWVVRSVTVCR